MTAYYNENDPFAAAWLNELIRDGLIAPGIVDTRSIEDIFPTDLRGFTQCHFFAGIGVWSLSLRVAGWPDDRPIWTGSCPCQPFSAAGKGAGFADERHLWPAWFHLIARGKRRDVPVVGEQVASKDGRAWFDLVSGDMEALDHACGAVDISAAGFGAPFIGQRLYWLAASDNARSQGRGTDKRSGGADQLVARQNSVVDGLGQTNHQSSERNTGTVHRTESRIDGAGFAEYGAVLDIHSDAVDLRGLAATEHNGSHRALGPQTEQDRNESHERLPVGNHADGRLAPPTSGQPRHGDIQPSGQPRHGDIQPSGQHGQQPQDPSDSDDSGIPLHPVEYWRNADWLLCRDPNGARFRPVEPGTFPLVDARSTRNRLGQVRGAGNALNIAQATCFIEAVMDHLDQ